LGQEEHLHSILGNFKRLHFNSGNIGNKNFIKFAYN